MNAPSGSAATPPTLPSPRSDEDARAAGSGRPAIRARKRESRWPGEDTGRAVQNAVTLRSALALPEADHVAFGVGGVSHPTDVADLHLGYDDPAAAGLDTLDRRVEVVTGYVVPRPPPE